jgi:3-phenylpropionate/cinnamic acid dioxygenase small subunit
LDNYGWREEEATAYLAWVRDFAGRVMRLNAEMTAAERLLAWQQHAVSQMQVRKGDFVLINLAAHPLDQTK